jgi:hypothetical protein
MKRLWIKDAVKSALRLDFMRREDGSIALEATIIMPVLFWTYLSMFSIFDAFRMYSVHQKAAFTIGDALSRETVPIDNDYFDGVLDLYEYLSRSQGQTSMRISSVWYDEENDVFNTDWSQTRGSMPALTSEDTQNWHQRIPVLVDNEHVIILETWSEYNPPFRTGLEEREIRNLVFTRPRYATCVLWIDNAANGCAPGS